mmetsp:Transcript_48819/g.148513  ORF Transcript_48819/g.148513 Transcript_48819/m.148513 type:complete len:238 (+) Transcript_48819:357-1070(+)
MPRAHVRLARGRIELEVRRPPPDPQQGLQDHVRPGVPGVPDGHLRHVLRVQRWLRAVPPLAARGGQRLQRHVQQRRQRGRGPAAPGGGHAPLQDRVLPARGRRALPAPLVGAGHELPDGHGRPRRVRLPVEPGAQRGVVSDVESTAVPSAAEPVGRGPPRLPACAPGRRSLPGHDGEERLERCNRGSRPDDGAMDWLLGHQYRRFVQVQDGERRRRADRHCREGPRRRRDPLGQRRD